MVMQPTLAEARTSGVFDALLWALSRPGDIRTMGADGIEAVAESLCDREVSLFCDDTTMQERLRFLGTRSAPRHEADYLLFSGAIDASLLKVGTMLYPERAATVIANAKLGAGSGFALTGPGVSGMRVVEIGGIDPAFWAARAAACRFPLGWDVFLVDGPLVMGLPRSTKIEQL
jgi:alpha-D-ribose 1-methylphosphonate 5-triphosphate synthase subunit PhnH